VRRHEITLDMSRATRKRAGTACGVTPEY